MSLNWILRKLRAFASKQKGGMIEDCPPDLYACEVCGKLDCRNEQWLHCRQRLAAAEFLKSGDQKALAELKALRIERDRELSCRRSAPAQDGEAEGLCGEDVSRNAT